MNGSDDHRRDDEQSRHIRKMKCAERKPEPGDKPTLDGVRERLRPHGEAPDSVSSK